MAFPDDPLCPEIELYYDGGWHSVGDDVDASDDVAIRHGRSDWAGKADPAQCTLLFNNVDGTYSPRNPRSPLYGKIGRNTPLRVRVGEPDNRLVATGVAGGSVSTPDTAALDITGDIDIRADVEPFTWRPGYGFTGIASKHTGGTANQRSWTLILLADGTLELGWTTDGTDATRAVPVSTEPVPADSGRLTVRAILDVDNGAGGHTVRFYTGPSVAGPWTQLGADVVVAGVTSIFSSTAPLAVASDLPTFPTDIPFSGEMWAFQLRNGVGGTVVADIDFSTYTSGTVLTDITGLMWTLDGAFIADESSRFAGEVTAWPSRWGSELDVRAPITASGMSRRLRSGSSALGSALYRGITGGNITSPVAYWPCEDASGATAFASALGQEPMRFIGDAAAVKPASFSDIASSLPIPTVTAGGRFQGSIPPYPQSNYMRGMALVNVPDGGVSSEQNLMRIRTIGGDTEAWFLNLRSDGSLRLICFAHGGATLVDQGVTFTVNGTSGLIWIYLEQTGADISWQIGHAALDSASAVIFGDTLVNKIFGRAHQIIISQNFDLNDVAIGHVHVLHTNEFWDILRFSRAWTGDMARTRALRLAAEENVLLTIDGVGDTRVGPQRPQAFLDLVSEATEVNLGVLLDRHDSLGLHFRARDTLYKQAPAVTLDYAAGEVAHPFEPVEDDQDIHNDITVSRTNGSSARATRETGPLNVNPSTVDPEGVGRYDDSAEINSYTDDQLADQAGWRLHLGTVDEARYPTITVDLHANPHLIDAVKTVKVGDRIVVTNPPPWLPPDQIDLIVQGYREVLNALTWKVTFNCTPGSPWNVWVLEDADYSRLDTGGSELPGAVDSTQTALDVATTSGPIWVTEPGQFPFPVKVGGEEVTVASIGGAVEDTFTRIESSQWGSADTGQSWTRTGGVASDLSVDGSRGMVNLSSTGSSRWVTAPGYADVDLTASVATDKLAVGAPQQVGLVCRYADTGNNYVALLQFLTTGSTILYLFKFVGGTGSILVSANPGITHVAGERYRIRLSTTGAKLKAKVWRVTDPEPNGWLLRATDSSHSTGAIGAYQILESGTTNAPVAVSWDDVELLNPQRFTVTRSVNGIVKSHSAGSAVSLADPAILAL